jgi:hypothetical protein
MKLAEMIKKGLKSRRLAKGLAAALATTPVVAAADFYDGMKGPSEGQVHYSLTISDEVSHTLAFKHFGEHVMGILSGTVTPPDGFQGGFAGVGYVGIDGFLPVLGYSVAGDGSGETVHAILQGTLEVGNGTVVLDGNYHFALPVSGDDHTPSHSFGVTPSVGMPRFRVGPDFGYTIGEDPTARLLMRYDIDAENHTSWVELGVPIDDGAVEVQFRGNF